MAGICQRDPRLPLAECDIMRNRFVWAALIGCSALLLVVVHISPIAAALHLAPLPPKVWLIVLMLSLMPVVLVQAGKAILTAGRKAA